MPWAKTRPAPVGKAAARGYGGKHKKLRAVLLPSAYGQPCSRCGQLMLPHQELHLDHNDSRTGYLGFSHAACNLKAAARKARRIQVISKGKRVVVRKRLDVMDDKRLSIMDTSREW